LTTTLDLLRLVTRDAWLEAGGCMHCSGTRWVLTLAGYIGEPGRTPYNSRFRRTPCPNVHVAGVGIDPCIADDLFASILAAPVALARPLREGLAISFPMTTIPPNTRHRLPEQRFTGPVQIRRITWERPEESAQNLIVLSVLRGALIFWTMPLLPGAGGSLVTELSLPALEHWTIDLQAAVESSIALRVECEALS
jgi:hypothetical protein